MPELSLTVRVQPRLGALINSRATPPALLYCGGRFEVENVVIGRAHFVVDCSGGPK